MRLVPHPSSWSTADGLELWQIDATLREVTSEMQTKAKSGHQSAPGSQTSGEINQVEPDNNMLNNARRHIYRLTVVITGSIADICWPSGNAGRLKDNLWQHTCAEWFIAKSGTTYIELNYSPSGDYAVYGFYDYRQRSEQLTGQLQQSLLAPELQLSKSAQQAQLIITQRLPFSLSNTDRMAVTFVLKTISGQSYYYAYRHRRASADFHDNETWTSVDLWTGYG